MENMKTGIIYRYTTPSGKVYIGQTVNEVTRKSAHKRKSESGELDTHFARAIRKYGWENIEYSILIKLKPTDDITKLKNILNKLETAYIKYFESDKRDKGYNLNKGGGGSSLGKSTPEEVKEKISIALTGRSKGPISDEIKAKMSKAKSKKMKPVCQYDLDDNFIQEFESISAAAHSIESKGTVISVGKKISGVCNGSGGRLTAYKFKWKFKKC
jgi:hypothetical protein